MSHRVAEIVSNLDVKEWHHIPGKMNVIDDCTRGKEIQELTPYCRWIIGLEFLMLHEAEWPSTKEVPVIDETELEIKGSVLAGVTTPSIDMVQWEKYSSWRKLHRLYAWWMRYKCVLRCKAKKISPLPERQAMVLRAAALEEASMALCKQAQVVSFKEDYKEMEANRTPNSSLLQLQPVLVDGIIRVGGRLTKAQIRYEAKHQVLLPPGHPLSRVLVQDIHERHFHVGREHTLALVRQKFWILRGKSFVRRIINDCLLCKRRRAKPTVPPRERLSLYQPPFANTGVNYFGPISVKRGRVTWKRWGCIFTCLTTRAVHLEVAGDLSTDSFIMALRRFRGRRGNPKTIRSNNGTNFVEANRELSEALKSSSQERITGELAGEGITWYFNPPSSPRMGVDVLCQL